MDSPQKSAKIDMSHGFMKSIVRNQVDRDNYDKEVKSKAQTDKRRGFPHNNKPKKPDAAIYKPPVKNEHFDDADEESESEEDDLPKTLFTLEFEDKDGKVYKQYVKEGITASLLAQRMGYDRGLTPAMTKALEQRLQEEIRKRSKKNTC